jgi:hypothetical protein
MIPNHYRWACAFSRASPKVDHCPGCAFGMWRRDIALDGHRRIPLCSNSLNERPYTDLGTAVSAVVSDMRSSQVQGQIAGAACSSAGGLANDA